MLSLPGWNSLPAVSRLHDLFEVGGIVILGLLVVAEVLAYRYGHRRDELLAIQEKATQEASNKRVEAAQKDATKVRNDLATAQQYALLAERAAFSRGNFAELIRRSQEHSPDAETAHKRRQQIEGELSVYEYPLPYAQSNMIVRSGGRQVSTGVEDVSVKDLFANLEESDIPVEQRRKLMALLVARLDKADSKRDVLEQAHRLLLTSDNLPAIAATCGVLHWLVRGDLTYHPGWVLDVEYWKKFAEQQQSHP